MEHLDQYLLRRTFLAFKINFLKFYFLARVCGKLNPNLNVEIYRTIDFTLCKIGTNRYVLGV